MTCECKALVCVPPPPIVVPPPQPVMVTVCNDEQCAQAVCLPPACLPRIISAPDFSGSYFTIVTNRRQLYVARAGTIEVYDLDDLSHHSASISVPPNFSSFNWLFYEPLTDRVYTVVNRTTPGQPAVCVINPDTFAIERTVLRPGSLSPPAVTAGMEYHVARGELWILDAGPGGIWTYDPVTHLTAGVYINPNVALGTAAGGGLMSGMAYRGSNQQMVLCGTDNNDVNGYLCVLLLQSPLSTPTIYNTGRAAGSTNVIYCPLNDAAYVSQDDFQGNPTALLKCTLSTGVFVVLGTAKYRSLVYDSSCNHIIATSSETNIKVSYFRTDTNALLLKTDSGVAEGSGFDTGVTPCPIGLPDLSKNRVLFLAGDNLVLAHT